MPRKKQHQWRNDPRGSDESSARPSRSAQKRRCLALQDIGERLTGLAPEILSNLGLPPALRDAVCRYSRMRGHEARRRQMQYIGRLMRELDEASLKALIQSGISGSSEHADLLAAAKSGSST
jgi:ribosome-associated protein